MNRHGYRPLPLECCLVLASAWVRSVVVTLTGHSSRLDVDPTMKSTKESSFKNSDTKHTIGHLESLEITSVMLKKNESYQQSCKPSGLAREDRIYERSTWSSDYSRFRSTLGILRNPRWPGLRPPEDEAFLRKLREQLDLGSGLPGYLVCVILQRSLEVVDLDAEPVDACE